MMRKPPPADFTDVAARLRALCAADRPVAILGGTPAFYDALGLARDAIPRTAAALSDLPPSSDSLEALILGPGLDIWSRPAAERRARLKDAYDRVSPDGWLVVFPALSSQAAAIAGPSGFSTPARQADGSIRLYRTLRNPPRLRTYTVAATEDRAEWQDRPKTEPTAADIIADVERLPLGHVAWLKGHRAEMPWIGWVEKRPDPFQPPQPIPIEAVPPSRYEEDPETVGRNTAATEDAAPTNTLVLFSGGFDSVYVLTRLLRETDDQVFAHHIHFLNPEGRHEAEARACRAIVAHLRETVRPFAYSEAALDRRRFAGFGIDDMAAGLEAGIVSRSLYRTRGIRIDRWTSGTCLEEEAEHQGSLEDDRFGHIETCVAAGCHPEPPPRFFQLRIVRKADQLRALGPELSGLCWTCRTPIRNADGSFDACGRCKSCRTLQRATESL